MKILFDNCDLTGSRTGPNSFALRLATELSKRGHILADPSDYEVALSFIERTRNADPNKPMVQRLDGIWFRPQDIHTRNVFIKRSYDAADVVVFQSSFDRRMVTKWFGPKINHKIIRNGISTGRVELSPDVLRIRNEYEKFFVCSANWHRQKRLKENVEMFFHLRNILQKKCCLVVLGNSPDHVVADKDIFYTNGSVAHDVCLQMFSAADWMIHCAWADHCPNTLVEALSQGCPVICSETGGSSELVGCNGIILEESLKYDFEAFDYENPPPLDVTQIKELPEIDVDAESVNMEDVVSDYENALKWAIELRT